jgi:hypothetical protein
MIGSTQDHRDKLDRFVCCENVARYRKMLSTESNEGERRILIHLLREEESRQGRLGSAPTGATTGPDHA